MKQHLNCLALMLLGAVLYALALPPVECTPLAWLAPAVWLWALRGRAITLRAGLVFGAGYATTALTAHWLFGLFSWLSVVLWAVPALYFSAWGLLAHWPQNLPRGAGLIWPAVAWTGIEYLRCEVAPLAFPFLLLGSTQVNGLGFGLASVVGVYGVSFVMVLSATLAVDGWSSGRRYAGLARAVAVPIAVFGLSLGYGALQDKPVKLGTALLQQLAQYDDIGSWTSLPPRPAMGTVDLVVWPELTLSDDPRRAETKWFTDMMRADAAGTRWGNIFGAVNFPDGSRSVNDPFYNTAWYMMANGTLLDSAGKNQPVQLINDGLPAQDVKLIAVGTESGDELHRAGVGVCYDGAFQQYARRMVGRGARYLVFPTMNLENWGRVQHSQHRRLFQWRAAETGRTVLVAAVSGPTFSALPGGHSTPRAEYHQTVALRRDIMSPVDTLYNRGGWVVGPACLVLLIAGALAMQAQRLRGRALA